ncbi:MAG TPA: FAD-dependent oxidoreductase [Methanomassiliicoccales archaeon]|nr:FAD-dependent oxidoreductase [Methanomassiliicoccales archaeon]
MARRIVVIGSGAAGMTAASTARETAGDAEITVITEDSHIAYSPCAIPFVIDGTIPDFGSIVMHTPEFYQKERAISVRTDTKVASVDLAGKKVMTAAGDEIAFDSLVLCPGGKVFVPPIAGADMKGVFPVHNLADGVAIQAALKNAKTVVVAGAGVIGLEMAVAIRNLGKEVLVIEMLPQVVPRLLDQDMAQLVQHKLEPRGIGFVLNTPIGSIKGKDKVEAVMAGGKEIACDMVILATGVRPNLELTNQMGLDVAPLGGVRVSPTLQPYSKGRLVKSVYLAGDVISCESAATPGPTMNQLGSAAVRQGRVAGINAAGGRATYPRVASPWISDLGEIQVAGTGISRSLADYYGITVAEGKAKGSTRSRYYPDGKPLCVKLLAEAVTHRIVGAQVVGGEEVNGRINWLTAAVLMGVTAEEFLISFENAYCPKTSPVQDVAVLAAEDLVAKMTK